jgi:hypothetical protein
MDWEHFFMNTLIGWRWRNGVLYEEKKEETSHFSLI